MSIDGEQFERDAVCFLIELNDSTGGNLNFVEVDAVVCDGDEHLQLEGLRVVAAFSTDQESRRTTLINWDKVLRLGTVACRLCLYASPAPGVMII